MQNSWIKSEKHFPTFYFKNLKLIFFGGKIISKLKPSKYLITFEKSINGYFIFFRKVREIQQKNYKIPNAKIPSNLSQPWRGKL